MNIEYYLFNGRWHWRLRLNNGGMILADSSVHYATEAEVLAEIAAINKAFRSHARVLSNKVVLTEVPMVPPTGYASAAQIQKVLAGSLSSAAVIPKKAPQGDDEAVYLQFK